VSDLSDPTLYLNRELQLLAFQERVLEEAADPRNPLLERAKFLGILGSNLAEFYMVRVAGLKQQIDADVREVSPDGLTPREQLSAVRERVAQILQASREVYGEVHGDLAEAGIHLLDYVDLNDEQKAVADKFFETTAFPVLTPLAFDPGRPFPHISNLSLNLAVLVRTAAGEDHFARVKIPRALPRLVPIPSPETGDPSNGAAPHREHHFVWLEQLVAAHLHMLFPGTTVLDSHPFRVTRSAEVAIQELEADDLLEAIEESLRKRRFGDVVRVTVTPQMPQFVREILLENLEADPADMVALQAPLGASDLIKLYALDRPDLKDPPFRPALLPELEDASHGDVFALIRDRDILLHRPFESFDPVVRLLRQAAQDPDVLAIKMTLYRVGRNSPIVEALLEAAQEGKEVTALVELKARFDEESNIEWARALEAEGVHVVYGLLGLKTHSKITLIVRREPDGIGRYLHFGTGNYNVTTATQYTDVDLMTCADNMADDASELFNFLTGYAETSSYDQLLVAPVEMRERFGALVRREMEHAAAGRPACAIIKTNSVTDERVVRLLYEASQAGVELDLIVRGMCSLRPGVPGVSDNIRVRSIVGRFLEHTRLMYFENDGDPSCLIGSADLMRRNLDRRIELMVPVHDPSLIKRLRYEILGAYLADNVKARIMQPDGSYVRLVPAEGEARMNAQELLLSATQER
jgi:polyphosphate kinase